MVTVGLDQVGPTYLFYRSGRDGMSDVGGFDLIFNLPPRPTQPSHPFVGRCNEYQQKLGNKQACHAIH